ncbi:MAG TPA: acireductone synthase [Candidatus Acidoferrum sp.]|nr:acireductone synthase [Candidatus Acidoferrum sp.]
MFRPRVHSTADFREVADVPVIDLARVKVVLLDIEGTTTPIEFVYQTLFPYARANLKGFLYENSGDLEVRDAILALKGHREGEIRSGKMPPAWIADTRESNVDSAAEYGLWLMDQDSKIGPLKILQGLIWRRGYEAGRLRGQVYSDVPTAFERWRRQAKEIAIYSSGSELAQKLLFGTTEFGDLTDYISSFFDTRVGAKTNAESYRRIATSLGAPEDRILFFSDAIAELNAARSAGMRTALVVRAGSGEGAPGEHSVIYNFDSLG